MKSKDLREHHRKVDAVRRQLEGYFRRGEKVRVYHGNTNSTRSTNGGALRIDISSLKSIIEVNEDERYAIVEPNVALDQLLDATLAYNLMPPVVSEFPGITIGGAIQGGAGESSSFKYGGVHDAAMEYEIMLGDGSLVVASTSENADLFWGLPASCGTLGLLMLVKIRLVPTKPYVRLVFETADSPAKAVDLIKRYSRQDLDFVDGIVFSPHKSVIMTGTFSDKLELPVSTLHRSVDEWFYLHADKVTKKQQNYEELVPIKEYLFRYDVGGFWAASFGYKLLHIPFNRLGRMMAARLFTTKNLYHFLDEAGLAQRFMVQDICLPESKVLPYLTFVDRQFGIYPLWLCSLKTDRKSPLSPTFLDTDLVINVGTWGDLHQDYEASVRSNRQLEKRVQDLGGRKVFYAHAYYSETEFWNIYDQKNYETLRNKYKATTTFPDVYQKITVVSRYKPSIPKLWLAIFRQALKELGKS